MQVHYLAYGSNLHPLRLTERIGSARLVGTLALPGFELTFAKRGQDGSGKCTIAEHRHHRVHAALYTIRRKHLADLDRIEGVGLGYDLESLGVECGGVRYEAVTYVATSTHFDRDLQPFHWYKELVRRGAEHHGFPQPYIDSIRAMPSIDDPDEARRRRHERLAGKLGQQGSVAGSRRQD